MGKVIGSCGHPLPDNWHDSDACHIATKDYDRKGNRAVSYMAVCEECRDWYEKNNQILKTAEEEKLYLSGEQSSVSQMWFIADEHFSHTNIIKYCKRPFKDVHEMNKTLTRKHNQLVSDNDIVYHVGDFTFNRPEDYLAKLKGRHILILGNHDRLKPFEYIDRGFESVHTSLELLYSGYHFILNHDPCAYCMIPEEAYLLHGHIHTIYKTLLPTKRIINVGVDVWNFAPVNFDSIIELIIKKEGEASGK